MKFQENRATHLYFIADFSNVRNEESKPPEPPKRKKKKQKQETEPNFEGFRCVGCLHYENDLHKFNRRARSYV